MKRGAVLALVFSLVACVAGKPPDTSPVPDTPSDRAQTIEASKEDVREALSQAERLEANGETAAALDQYDWAFLAEGDRDRQADILYRIACLRADPKAEVHDLGAAREELGLLTRQYPDYPRQREADLILRLVDALTRARAEADSSTRNTAALRRERDALHGQLKKAEEELEKIKEVLLQGTP